MKNLTRLFKIMEITRNQTQYGYNLSGIQKSDLSDLAQHHYLVTFIAWQLGLHLKRKGARIDMLKVLEIALVHDIGELFGGDLSFHYARVNKKAREAAKVFQKENLKFLSIFFQDTKQLLALDALETGETPSDEGVIVRFADLVECLHYKITVDKLQKNDIKQTVKDLQKSLMKSKSLIIKIELKKFLTTWSKNLLKENVIDIIWGLKN